MVVYIYIYMTQGDGRSLAGMRVLVENHSASIKMLGVPPLGMPRHRTCPVLYMCGQYSHICLCWGDQYLCQGPCERSPTTWSCSMYRSFTSKTSAIPFAPQHQGCVVSVYRSLLEGTSNNSPNRGCRDPIQSPHDGLREVPCRQCPKTL